MEYQSVTDLEIVVVKALYPLEFKARNVQFVWLFLSNAELTPMPTIYRITTDEDDEEEKASLPTGAAGAVIMDGEQGGQFVSCHLALRKAGEWIPIRHPIEDSDLEANGETFSGAKQKGILWQKEPFLCLHCGEHFYQPQIQAHVPFRFLIPPIVGLVVIIVFRLILNTTWSYTLLTGFFSVIVSIALMELMARIVAKAKLSDEERQLTLTKCDKCGAHQLKSIESVCGKTIRLRTGKNVRVSRAGIS